MCMFDVYLKVFTLNSRFFDALLKVPLYLGLQPRIICTTKDKPKEAMDQNGVANCIK